MIVLVATFKAKKGCEESLENTLKTLIPYVQNEAGTLTYTLHRGINTPDKLLFYEAYRDKEAREFHRSQSYVKEILGSISNLIEEQPTIEVYEEIASLRRP